MTIQRRRMVSCGLFLVLCSAASCHNWVGTQQLTHNEGREIAYGFAGTNSLCEELQPVFDVLDAAGILFVIESNTGVDEVYVHRRDSERAMKLLRASSLVCNAKDVVLATGTLNPGPWPLAVDGRGTSSIITVRDEVEASGDVSRQATNEMSR
jgi:hypothetical protein